MKIDDRLYLVLPVDRADGTTVWIHAQAISREVFEQYWLLLSKTWSGLLTETLLPYGGPRVINLMMKQVATSMRIWEGPNSAQALLAEIRRLAMVLVAGQPVPLEQALSQGTITEDDAIDVGNALSFFTLASHLASKSERRALLNGLLSVWGARIESLDCMAFNASLQTLIATANSGETPPTPSLQPSSIGPQDQVTRPSFLTA